MAFDFTNRDPKDPKGVKKVTLYATKIYLPAKENDWSDSTTDPSAASQRGLTRQVDASLVTLNNGDQYFAVQDGQGKPIDIIGDTTGKDADTAREWQQTAPKPLPPGASPTQRQPDGSINAYNPATGVYDTPTGSVAETPASKRTAREEAEIAANAALPANLDPRSETNAERAARADATIKQQGADAEAGRQRQRQDEADARAAAAEKRAAEDQAAQRKSEAEATAERNKPKPQQDPNGNWGYFDTSKPGAPPQWVPIPSGPQASPKPVQVNGQWGVWQPNAADPKQPPTFVTIEVPKSGVTLKNVDAWEPDFSQPDLGLGAWATKQRQKIGLPAEQGGITQDDYDGAVKQAHDAAGTTITNVTNATNVVRQQGLDQESLRKTRSDEAGSDFNNALGVFNQVWKYADPKTGSIRNLIPGLMAEQGKYRREREASTPALPGLHPMFQIASAQSAANAHPPAAQEQAAGTGPAPAAYQPPAVPNDQAASAQAEAERQRAMAQAAGGAPTPVEPGGPPLAPGPVLGASVVPTPPPGAAVPPVAAPAMAVPPAPAPSPTAPPPQADVFSPVQGNVRAAASAPGNQNLGQPGDSQAAGPPTTDPTVADPAYLQPQYPPSPYTINQGQNPYPQQDSGDVQSVGMQPGQGPLTAFANGAMGAGQPPAPQPDAMNPALQNVAQQAQAGQGGYDPIEEAAKLVAMGVPRELAAQAVARAGLIGPQQRQMMGSAA